MNTIYNLILLVWETIKGILSMLTLPATQHIYPFIAFGMLLGAICALPNLPKFKR